MKSSYFKFIFNKNLLSGLFLSFFLFFLLNLFPLFISEIKAKETNFGLRILTAEQTIPDENCNLFLNNTTPQGIIPYYLNSDCPSYTAYIASETTNPYLNYDALITNGEGTFPQTTINSNRANVTIPTSTIITSADTSWDGIMMMPTVTTVTLPTTSGVTKTLSEAIEIGYSGAKLSFNKGVRILFPNEKDKKIGYTRTGLAFTEITTICSEDSQAAGNALSADGDCKINVGVDLVVWTKHFTKFATYTQVTNTVTDNSSSTTISTNNTASPPVCNDSKPVSAPILISTTKGTNSVTLTWSKALNPVTYYLVAYGTSSNNLQFGNPNVGNQDTTSYTVKNLSGGTTYYFKVKAVNNCMPGDYSNELSAKPNGEFVSSPAKDFIDITPTESTPEQLATPKQGVTPEIKITPVEKATPEQLLLFKDETQTLKTPKSKFSWVLIIAGIVILFTISLCLYLRFKKRQRSFQKLG